MTLRFYDYREITAKYSGEVEPASASLNDSQWRWAEPSGNVWPVSMSAMAAIAPAETVTPNVSQPVSPSSSVTHTSTVYGPVAA